ncbi:MAG TPA: DUF2278 family protein [Thermoanaerobaculia bacterium]|jgi:uncharacterized protein YukJ
MPLKDYGVLVGRPIDRRNGTGQNPHYQIHMVDDDTDYRIAVNVQSSDKSAVQYLVIDHFEHDILDELALLKPGWHNIPSKPGGIALDYIRANIVERDKFVALPFNIPGPDNDLNEKVDAQISRALGDEDSLLYAFGERWGRLKPEPQKDKIFGFAPGNGVHDIHANQGNDPGHKKDDGVWQDGGVLIHYPKTNQWVGIFLRFQSQSWHTDDVTGHALSAPIPDVVTPGDPIQPTTDNPDGIVRIVAALVNAKQSPEIETVTLVNTSPNEIQLAGWSLVDKQKKKMPLSGSIAAGAALNITVKKPMELSNKGGIITIVNDDGLKVDGVAYTKAQASNPGWTIVF